MSHVRASAEKYEIKELDSDWLGVHWWWVRGPSNFVTPQSKHFDSYAELREYMMKEIAKDEKKISFLQTKAKDFRSLLQQLDNEDEITVLEDKITMLRKEEECA